MTMGEANEQMIEQTQTGEVLWYISYTLPFFLKMYCYKPWFSLISFLVFTKIGVKKKEVFYRKRNKIAE